MLVKHPFFPPKLTTPSCTVATIGSRFVSLYSSAAAVSSAFAFHTNSPHSQHNNNNNNNNNVIELPHLIFGYGSLLCPESRQRTAPTVADRVVLPVSIQGIERRWAKASPTMRTTTLGVEFCEGGDYDNDEYDTDDSHSRHSSSSNSNSANSSGGCIGILLPVTTAELRQFDQREIGYDRYAIPLSDVRPIPHLISDEDDEDDDSIMTTGTSASAAIYKNTFLDPELQAQMLEYEREGQCPQIWTYVTRHPLAASSDYPIAQSYVDIVLRGCLTISKSFAQEFIQTTKGWDPQGDQERPSCSDTTTTTTIATKIMQEKREYDAEEEAGGWWVEDRHNPLYIRADREYSLQHAHMLDQLLQDNLPRREGSGGSSGGSSSSSQGDNGSNGASWLLAKRIPRGGGHHHHPHPHHKKTKKGRTT